MNRDIEQLKKMLKRSIRHNYKLYIDRFKSVNTLEELIDTPKKAAELAFVKECHYFFMCDMEYNYYLFKSIYDRAFKLGFHEFSNCNLYHYLIIKFKYSDTFDFQCWSGLTEFFIKILKEEDDEAFFNEILKAGGMR